MRGSSGDARFEAHGPPAARPLKRSPDLSRQMVTKDSAAHVKEQRPDERKLPNRVPPPESSVPSPDIDDLLHFCWQTGHLRAISSTSQLVRCNCSRRSCTQVIRRYPTTNYHIDARSGDEWSGPSGTLGGPRGPPHLRAVTHRFLNSTGSRPTIPSTRGNLTIVNV